MVKPQCSYFGKCGGCSSQHLDYSIQLENKRKALSSYTKFDDIKVFSGPEYGYRNRMDFIFHEKGLGLRESGRWDKIVDVELCPISEPQLNSLLSELRAAFQDCDYFDIKKRSGTFRYAVVRTSQDASSISFVLNGDSENITEALDKIRQFSQKTTADSIIVTYVPKDTDVSIGSNFLVVKGSDRLLEAYLGYGFTYSAQGFFQNNHALAEQMQAYVHRLLKKYDTGNAHLLDLYSGVGTFGITNARHFKSVTMVESIKECIDSCKSNLEINKVTNGQAILLDARQIKKLDVGGRLFVITDPPRSGMHPDTLSHLVKLEPEVIIYVSCNPVQLSRDLPRLRNYAVQSVALFDLFPQTQHSEAVVELVKIT